MSPQLYQFLGMMAQRAGNTQVGRAATGLAERGGQAVADIGRRGLEAAGRLENRFPSLPRGPGGQFPSRTAAERVTLQPFSRGAAGVAGAGSAAMGGAGSFGTISNPLSSPAPSNMQDVFAQLDRQTRGEPTVMDSIMAASQPQQSGAFGLQGFNMPPTQYGSDNGMFAGPGGGEMYSNDPSRSVMSQVGSGGAANIPMPPPRPSLPGRTPGFLDQLLSGPNYQSNNMPVDIRAQGPSMPGQEMPIQSINWGDAQNPADFFRADQLMMQNPNIPGFLGGY